jgi:phosphate transport system substrate-binding protein
MGNMAQKSVIFVRSILVLTIIAGLFSGCSYSSSADPQSGQITISGAFALYPMMVKWAEEYQKLHSGIRIDVSAGGAGKGMADALAGAVEIGMVSREIKNEELSQGAFGIAVTRDAVFLGVNAQNPYLERLMAQGISVEILTKIFISGEVTNWGQVLNDPSITDEIHVYTRSDACGAAEMWAKFLGGSAQEDLKGVGVSGDPGLLDAVIQDPLGIGYNNLNYAFDPTTGKPVAGAIVVPVDLNQNGQADEDELYRTRDVAMQAIADGKYPSPPARLLYLVTKGKPDGILRDFVLWILTDGQQYVPESGYVSLTEAELAAEQAKLQP